MENVRRWLRRKVYDWFGLIHEDSIEPALCELAETYDFVRKSGHLSNGYAAGKKVKRGIVRTMNAFLDARNGERLA